MDPIGIGIAGVLIALSLMLAGLVLLIIHWASNKPKLHKYGLRLLGIGALLFLCGMGTCTSGLSKVHC